MLHKIIEILDNFDNPNTDVKGKLIGCMMWMLIIAGSWAFFIYLAIIFR